MKVGLATAGAAWLVTGDWLIAVSFLVLTIIWQALRVEEGPPVLPLAVTLQWLAVVIGVFYVEITGRPLQGTLNSDYRPMVVLGLVAVSALVAGLALGLWLIRRLKPVQGVRPEYTFTFKTLAFTYVVWTGVAGTVNRLAWDVPSITQAIIAITYLRLGVLYLVLRRFVLAGRWNVVGVILAFEIVMGISGFYAGFREPLIMAALVLLEIFDRRSVKQWALAIALGCAMATLGVIWMSVRTEYRQRFELDESFANSRTERIDTLGASIRSWASQDYSDFEADVDKLVDRLWTVYYPALAVERVPRVLPHTNGQLLWTALQHVFTPRIFFPDKAGLTSDSEMVRKYSGVMVAGEAESTTIAFGYVAESYVDFGVPLMFLPVFVYGCLMGLAYAGLLRLIRHRDLAISVVCVIGWLSLYLFERSWVKTLGLSGTLLIYVGGITLILDHLWLQKYLTAHPEAQADHPPLAENHHPVAHVR